MSIYVLPYKMASASAKELADYLGCRRIKADKTSRWRPREDKWVINWGSSKVDLAHMNEANIINPMEVVNVAADKLKAFQLLREAGNVPLPAFTSDIEEAKQWIADGGVVVCRTILRGHSGDGIILADTVDKLVEAPLYTLYFKKKTEYRFHVVGDRVVDIARKARKFDVADEEVNWQIRNLKGGFIYAREGVNPPNELYDYAVNTIKALSLDFGAVDIIWNDSKKRGVVLEVNCAPGLSGSTVGNYANALDNLIYSRSRKVVAKSSLKRKRFITNPVKVEDMNPVQQDIAPVAAPLLGEIEERLRLQRREEHRHLMEILNNR